MKEQLTKICEVHTDYRTHQFFEVDSVNAVVASGGTLRMMSNKLTVYI